MKEKQRLGPAGTALIKKWEGCHKLRSDGRFAAYPDPGSIDGKPWTIGWGSTGADVRKGTIWTKAECDARFTADIQRYVAAVARALGTAPTSQNQFDALVSFHYNTGAIAIGDADPAAQAGQICRCGEGICQMDLQRRKADEGPDQPPRR